MYNYIALCGLTPQGILTVSSKGHFHGLVQQSSNCNFMAAGTIFLVQN